MRLDDAPDVTERLRTNGEFLPALRGSCLCHEGHGSSNAQYRRNANGQTLCDSSSANCDVQQSEPAYGAIATR
ncbi:hypothetical protein GCM10027091_00800 [Streptomyces daliensis]